MAARRVGAGGLVLAMDLLDMEPIHGVDFIQGDFRDEEILAKLEEKLAGRPLGLVMSDMAPICRECRLSIRRASCTSPNSAWIFAGRI